MSKHALCVGINYEGTSSALPDCVKDANDAAECLTERGFTVQLMTEKAATASAMIGALSDTIHKAQSGDIVVFTFSGHGSWVPDQSGDEPDQRDEILCPVDIFENNYVVDDQLNEVFSERGFGVRIVFLSDSCHSGTVHKFAALPQSTSPPTAPKPQSARRVRFLPPANFMKALAARTPIDAAPPPPVRASSKPGSPALLISGCQDWEYSYSTGNGGAFTIAWISSLAENEILSNNDWYRAIRTKLPNAEYQQTPAIRGTTHQRRLPALEEGR